MKRICIFGSSSPKEGSELFERARELGKELAKRNIEIANGGYGGTMKGAAMGAHEQSENENPSIEGVTVPSLFETIRKSTDNSFLTKRTESKDIFERFRFLTDPQLFDAFIIFEGNIGSLNELILVWTQFFLLFKFHLKKPKLCLVFRFWENIINFLKENVSIDDFYVDENDNKIPLFTYVDSVDDVTKILDELIKNN
ncbi:cytokinin riboside 5'-monophosphate phosphoribohydrolase [Anaeramoeba ignava]|uniref:Cytokinin riboside 5'-monophosphate phosphoribohydrolase n=1 Tax=Anaeramoeba ignava TaxID=1746090 RepID=A0A9Q0RDU2_ANAIG|nr:cytokinin riboside 5'-monophosphate phosphoribohydrolase [Anaeramoeba ignava]